MLKVLRLSLGDVLPLADPALGNSVVGIGWVMVSRRLTPAVSRSPVTPRGAEPLHLTTLVASVRRGRSRAPPPGGVRARSAAPR